MCWWSCYDIIQFSRANLNVLGLSACDIVVYILAIINQKYFMHTTIYNDANYPRVNHLGLRQLTWFRPEVFEKTTMAWTKILDRLTTVSSKNGSEWCKTIRREKRHHLRTSGSWTSKLGFDYDFFRVETFCILAHKLFPVCYF